MESSITTQKGGAIAVLEFYHPKANSLPLSLLTQLEQSIHSLSMGTKVIIIRSKGMGAFCAGASFDDMIKLQDFDQAKEFFLGFAQVINSIRLSNKIVIMAVQGKAIGGGVGLIAAADYVIASDQAALKLSELRLGIGPFVIEPALRRKLSLSAFSTLALSPFDWKDANWGLANGLINEVVNANELEQKVLEKAEELSALSHEALVDIKTVLWEGTDHWDELLDERAELSGKLVLSDITQKAIQNLISS